MADTLEDIFNRHLIYLQRLVPQLGKEQIKIIDKNNPELRGEIASWLDKNELFKLTIEQQNQIAVLRNKVFKLRGGAISDASVSIKVICWSLQNVNNYGSLMVCRI